MTHAGKEVVARWMLFARLAVTMDVGLFPGAFCRSEW